MALLLLQPLPNAKVQRAPTYREQPYIQFRLDWREERGPFQTVTRDLQRTGVWLSGRSLAWNSPVTVRVVLGISTVVECCTSICAQGPGCSPQPCRNKTECRDARWLGGPLYQVLWTLSFYQQAPLGTAHQLFVVLKHLEGPLFPGVHLFWHGHRECCSCPQCHQG